jgi:hypothetical protein
MKAATTLAASLTLTLIMNSVQTMKDFAFGAGTVLVERAVIQDTMLAGLMLEIVPAATHRTTLRDVVLSNVAANFSGHRDRFE